MTGQWIGAIAVTLLFSSRNATEGARAALLFASLSTMVAALASARRSALP